MSNVQPLVTVYIPTFNRLELLKRAVKSVQDQTYENLEIIIVDDCSTDGTQEYLAQLANDDKRVRYFLKDNNSGACVSRNIAIDHAKGKFITGLDDDDYFMKNRIEIFLKKWSIKSSNIIFLFDSYLIKKGEEIISPNHLKYFKKNIYDFRDLLIRNFVGNQIFIETDIFRTYEGFDETLSSWQDLDAWMNILNKSAMKAEYIGSQTYVVDISHDFNRISEQKISKIYQSYEKTTKKYCLSFMQKNALYFQLVDYSSSFISIDKLLFRVLFTKDYKDLRFLFYFIRNKIKGI